MNPLMPYTAIHWNATNTEPTSLWPHQHTNTRPGPPMAASRACARVYARARLVGLVRPGRPPAFVLRPLVAPGPVVRRWRLPVGAGMTGWVRLGTRRPLRGLA